MSRLLVVLALVVVIVYLTQRKRGGPDDAVLGQLRAAGDRLDTPRLVEFFSYFPTKKGAQEFEVAALAAGFLPGDPTAGKDDQKFLHCALLTQSLIPTPASLLSSPESLTLLSAAPYGTFSSSVSPLFFS